MLQQFTKLWNYMLELYTHKVTIDPIFVCFDHCQFLQIHVVAFVQWTEGPIYFGERLVGASMDKLSIHVQLHPIQIRQNHHRFNCNWLNSFELEYSCVSLCHYKHKDKINWNFCGNVNIFFLIDHMDQYKELYYNWQCWSLSNTSTIITPIYDTRWST